jgi:hypothetical protein
MNFDPYDYILNIQESIRIPTPKWELTWECGGSFPHTLLHSREHEMPLSSSLLAYTFASPCLGREPKVRVVTFSPIKEEYNVFIDT